MTNEKPKGSTPRTQELLRMLTERATTDRSGEWFSQEMFPEVSTLVGEDIIIRRARACEAMFQTMANPKYSETTHTFEIKKGELIVGVIPLGSVGLGKAFPQYMNEKERRLASVTSRDVQSVFGHNCPDFERVLNHGLKGMLDFCKERIEFLQIEKDYPLGKNTGASKKLDFYRAVEICSNAIVAYAAAFADLAESESQKTTDASWKQDLTEIARICRKVPLYPADTFHEAVQSIYFMHLALHSTMDLTSPGRLDQVLQPYYEKDVAANRLDDARATELLECFLIKCAERLNMTSAYLVQQDHLDFGTGLGTNPVFLDQFASANNFMQNIAVGGRTRDGRDAVNQCSYLFLDACMNVGLPTPAVCARIHKDSPAPFLEKIAECLKYSGASLPIVYNDDTITPGFESAGFPIEEARDYVADGCWEPILNAKGDWTFGTLNMLTVLHCAVNSGAVPSSNPSLLRGSKKSYATPLPEQLDTFEKLQEAFRLHLQFFVDQVVLNIYKFYTIDQSVTPTPILSSILSTCLKVGMDKTWGGAEYIVGGVISTAIPNAANALAAVKKFVYEDNKYTLRQIVDAISYNFGKSSALTDSKKKELYGQIQTDLISAPKFGNGDSYADDIMKWLMDEYRSAIYKAEALADQVFLDIPKTPAEEREMSSLRNLVGYSGVSMKEYFGSKFDINFNAGAGTFGQYSFQGQGIPATPDGREDNQPLAPNCSPVSGTVKMGVGHALKSLDKLGLDRFGAGVMVDLCLEENVFDVPTLVSVIKQFVAMNGNITSISVIGSDTLNEIFNIAEEVRQGKRPASDLNPYSQISVRVGGWNAPFVTFTRDQQMDYLKRIMKG
ncbi:MAG: pyruvate formate lyase family protein [Candidatus Omnitrophota bacterium]